MKDIYRLHVGALIAGHITPPLALLVAAVGVDLARKVHGNNPKRSQVIDAQQALIDGLGDLLAMSRHDPEPFEIGENLDPYQLANAQFVLDQLTSEWYVAPPHRPTEDDVNAALRRRNQEADGGEGQGNG